MNTSEKKQHNTRIPMPVYDAEQKVRARLDWTADEIAEVAYASLFGSRDSLIVAKRQKIKKAFKELGLELSFDAAPGQPPELELVAA
jgi:hypothetical protein